MTLIKISVSVFPLDKDFDPDLHNQNDAMRTLKSLYLGVTWNKTSIETHIT